MYGLLHRRCASVGSSGAAPTSSTPRGGLVRPLQSARRVAQDVARRASRRPRPPTGTSEQPPIRDLSRLPRLACGRRLLLQLRVPTDDRAGKLCSSRKATRSSVAPRPDSSGRESSTVEALESAALRGLPCVHPSRRPRSGIPRRELGHPRGIRHQGQPRVVDVPPCWGAPG